jgi:hypothetical protein
MFIGTPFTYDLKRAGSRFFSKSIGTPFAQFFLKSGKY